MKFNIFLIFLSTSNILCLRVNAVVTDILTNFAVFLMENLSLIHSKTLQVVYTLNEYDKNSIR